jgi:hypothetical protein
MVFMPHHFAGTSSNSCRLYPDVHWGGINLFPHTCIGPRSDDSWISCERVNTGGLNQPWKWNVEWYCYILLSCIICEVGKLALAGRLTLVKSGRRNPGRHAAGRLSFRLWRLMSGFLLWNLLHVTLLPPWILRWLLDFLKNLCTRWLNIEGSGIAIFTRLGTHVSVLWRYRNDARRVSDGSGALRTGLFWIEKLIFACYGYWHHQIVTEMT